MVGVLKFDDKDAEAVGDAAADHSDNQHRHADDEALCVLTAAAETRLEVRPFCSDEVEHGAEGKERKRVINGKLNGEESSGKER